MAILRSSPSDIFRIAFSQHVPFFSSQKCKRGEDDDYNYPESLSLDGGLLRKFANNKKTYSLTLIEVSGVDSPSDVILETQYYNAVSQVVENDGQTIYLCKYRHSLGFQNGQYFWNPEKDLLKVNMKVADVQIKAYNQDGKFFGPDNEILLYFEADV